MCGFAGLINLGAARTHDQLRCDLQPMTNRLQHRGPDDSGAWVDAATGVALGHRRLAVIDISMQGRQPMFSPCQRYAIVFNGEIYNYREIRTALEQGNHCNDWRGQSDTEVLLAAISSWGIKNTLTCLVGMFAFALWDRQQQELFLVRDRIGEKPLYYGWGDQAFLFASELKSLHGHPNWRAELSQEALALYISHGYVPAPYSIYKNIFKVPPGVSLQLPLKALVKKSAQPLQGEAYWTAQQAVAFGAENPFPGNPVEAADQLEELLSQAVSQQMVADVPLGAFLSGGVDSTMIVALMQKLSPRPVRTFTIGFNETAFDEAKYAKQTAQALSTDHTELYVTSEDVRQVIPRLPLIYDEPFADSSQIPTFLVAELARRHVTVCLSGDGGDELFAGYNRYFLESKMWKILALCPASLRRSLAACLNALPPKACEVALFWLHPLFRKYGSDGLVSDKLKKLAAILSANSLAEINTHLTCGGQNPSRLLLGSCEPATFFDTSDIWNWRNNAIEQLMCLDLVTYLPDDILVKVDRAAMASSLETRIPFLDHRVIEFAWSLPLDMKIRDQSRKWLLKEVLKRHVPASLFDRPKAGFSIPLREWLRGPLVHWADQFLDEKRLTAAGIFNAKPICSMWREHRAGSRDWHSVLWRILMFQAWHEYWMEKR